MLDGIDLNDLLDSAGARRIADRLGDGRKSLDEPIMSTGFVASGEGKGGQQWEGKPNTTSDPLS